MLVRFSVVVVLGDTVEGGSRSGRGGDGSTRVSVGAVRTGFGLAVAGGGVTVVVRRIPLGWSAWLVNAPVSGAASESVRVLRLEVSVGPVFAVRATVF